MIYLMVRNRVKDYSSWRKYFIRELPRGAAAGLSLVDLWRDTEDPNHVFFQLAVRDIEKAKALMADPDSVRAGEESGVLEGEAWFVIREDQAIFSGSSA